MIKKAKQVCGIIAIILIVGLIIAIIVQSVGGKKSEAYHPSTFCSTSSEAPPCFFGLDTL